MNPWLLMASAIVLSGATCPLFAGDSPTSEGAAKPGIITMVESHYRIFKLEDRIKNQRKRIDKGLAESTLTQDEAKTDRDVINTVSDAIKADAKANGAKKIMTRDQYAAYNASLDVNSAKIREERRLYYYYGPYADMGPDYTYYFDPIMGASAPAPSLSAMEVKNPRIFELKDRIKNQRARVDQGIKDASMTEDDAKICRAVLDKLESRINSDHKADGTKAMSKEKYDAYNADLDANSAALQEQKNYFYYYSPYYDRYSYWD